jgi:hypothetical protein
MVRIVLSRRTCSPRLGPGRFTSTVIAHLHVQHVEVLCQRVLDCHELVMRQATEHLLDRLAAKLAHHFVARGFEELLRGHCQTSILNSSTWRAA